MSNVPSYFERIIEAVIKASPDVIGESSEVNHDQTQGGTAGNPHAQSASTSHATSHASGGADELSAADLAGVGVASGVASLNSDGVLPNAQVPPLAINETYSVAQESDLTTLSQAEVGDVGIVTNPDPDVTYILTGDYSVQSDWQQIAIENAPVSSVNGQVGVVNLTSADVGAASDNHDNTAHSETYALDSDLYTDEKAQDAAAALINASGDLSAAYDDANDTLTLDVSTTSQEDVEDIVSSLLASDSNLSWSYNDSGDTLTISLADEISVTALDVGGLSIDGSYPDRSTADSNASVDDIVYLEDEQTLAVKED